MKKYFFINENNCLNIVFKLNLLPTEIFEWTFFLEAIKIPVESNILHEKTSHWIELNWIVFRLWNFKISTIVTDDWDIYIVWRSFPIVTLLWHWKYSLFTVSLLSLCIFMLVQHLSFAAIRRIMCAHKRDPRHCGQLNVRMCFTVYSTHVHRWFYALVQSTIKSPTTRTQTLPRTLIHEACVVWMCEFYSTLYFSLFHTIRFVVFLQCASLFLTHVCNYASGAHNWLISYSIDQTHEQQQQHTFAAHWTFGRFSLVECFVEFVHV